MLRLTTLGAVDLRDDHGRPLRDVLRQPKRLALLVYLALESTRTLVSRDRLLALFWPEADEEHARNALSQLLHQLRAALGRDLFTSNGPGLIGVASGALWCDAAAFEEALARGDRDIALDLYRGEFCPALYVSGAPDLERWLEERRRYLGRAAFDAMMATAAAHADAGDLDRARTAARRALDQRPDDEADVRALLTVLARAGDAAGALREYDAYVRRLARDDEAQPEAATQRLAADIRGHRDRQEIGIPAAAAPVDPASAASGPPAAPQPTPPPRNLRRMKRLALAFAVVVLGGVSAVALSNRDGRADPAVRTIAVFPFTVSGADGLRYLRHGMVDLLSAKLDGAAGFRAIDPRSVISAAASREAGAARDVAAYGRIARSLGARRYILGDIVGVGDQVHVNASLYDVREPGAATTASVAGPAPTMLDLVDGLAARLLTRIAAGRDTSLTQLGAVTTRSLPALIAFLRGEEALRQGHDAAAVAAFREAVILDSTFALAHYRMATATVWVGGADIEDPGIPAARAARHASRLTPLARDLLDAYVAYRELRLDDAERAYLALVDARPDNVEASYMLAETQFHYNTPKGRASTESRPRFERVLSLDPGNPHALLHLARLAALEGRHADLDSLVSTYVRQHGGAERSLELRALSAYARRDTAERRRVLDAAAGADDVVLTGVVQAALNYAQDLHAADELISQFFPRPRPSYYQRWLSRALTDAIVGRGQLARARELAGSARDDGWLLEGMAFVASNPGIPVPRASVLELRSRIAAQKNYPSLVMSVGADFPAYGPRMQQYLVGVLSARLGDTVTLKRTMEALERVREGDGAQIARALTPPLRAELLRARGAPGLALQELEQFRPVVLVGSLHGAARWGLRERFTRAELLREMGRDREALAAYASIEGYYDASYFAVAHLRRAEISEKLGDREHALFHYGRFIDMWRDCDPELRPLVARAERAVAALTR
jgi:serine/threonine-protein kinase